MVARKLGKVLNLHSAKLYAQANNGERSTDQLSKQPSIPDTYIDPPHPRKAHAPETCIDAHHSRLKFGMYLLSCRVATGMKCSRARCLRRHVLTT